MKETSDTIYLLDDAAIKTLDEDNLGRKKFAIDLGKSILNIKADNGFVFALEGEWGSGKTSIMNMAIDYLEKNPDKKEPIIIIRFNPWWFSGQNQLIKQFFNEFTSKLSVGDISLEKISKLLNCFSKIVAPLQYIPVYGIAAKILSDGSSSVAGGLNEIAQEKEENVQSIRDKIDKAIKKQEARFLIVIDDIDRLTSEEVCQLFRVVKAIANFPKTIYLLSYDEEIVIDSLGGVQGDNGKKYLEKIVQVSVDVPMINKTKLRNIFSDLLDKILKETPKKLINDQHFTNIYRKGIDHFLCSIRDVNRLINRLQAVYPPVKDEVNAIEFIVLQTLKVFHPKVYQFIKENKEMFVGTSLAQLRNDPEFKFQTVLANKVLEKIPDKHRDHVQEILLFLSDKWAMYFRKPSAKSNLRKNLCLTSPEIFDIYFRFDLTEEDFSSLELETILSQTNDPVFLKKIYQKLYKEKNNDKSSKLNVFLKRSLEHLDDIPLENIQPIIESIFGEVDGLLREDNYERDNVENAYLFIMITKQLLLRLENQEKRFEIIKQAFESGKSIYIPINFIFDISNESNGHSDEEAFLSEAHLCTLRENCVNKSLDAIKNKSISSFFPSIYFNRIVDFLYENSENKEKIKKYVHELIKDENVLCQFLEDFVIESRVDIEEDCSFDCKRLERFIPCDEELLSKCKKIISDSPEWLTEEQKRALNLLIKEFKIHPTI